MSDLETLQRHVRHRDPRAFEDLVARHLDWVYSAALRQVRDPHTADDVTQAVFLALSQQAGKLAEGVVLTAWLFRVTRHASAMALRAAGRRRKHERRAAMMADEARDAIDEKGWETLAPVLDEAVAELSEADRRSILLRYYERKSFAEIAAALSIAEPAVRKRVSRAVAKLRVLLDGKGITCTATALAVGLTNYTTQTAPASTAASVAATVATPTAASVAVVSLARGALDMMRWTSVKIGAGVGLLVLGVIGLSFAVAQVAGSNKPEAGGKPAAGGAAAPAATRPATKPVAGGPAAVAAAATPKEVVEVAYRAGLAGDEDALIRAFTGLTADQEATVRRVARVMGAVSELQKAIAAKFGEEAGKQFGALGVGVRAADVLEAPEKITGNRAVVDMGPSGPGEVPLEKVGDTWKISASVLQTLNVNMVGQWERKAPAVRELAADITAGKYATVKDLQQAVAGLMR